MVQDRAIFATADQ